MTMNRHEEWDELVSASLTGDLTNEERSRLDAHLAGCADCRATLAAFSDQRQIVAGLRHLPVPADLNARVRTGIDGGSRVGLPWWRRPATLFAGVGGGLAVVAGALLAIVLLNGPPDPQIGDASPTLSGTLPAASATSMPSVPAPTASPSESAAVPSAEPTPAPTPVAASPEPDVYLALTGPFDNQMLTLRHGPTGETIMELGTSAVPIAAELSPDGQWLAYITQLGDSGLNELRATRIAEGIPSDSPVGVGETILLGESVAGGPFLEHLAWSSDSQYLSYTLADLDTNGTDVWIFQPELGEAQQLTDVATAYTGTWAPGEAGTPHLWVSVAGDEPVSYLLAFDDSAGGSIVSGDPAADPMAVAEGVFQPLLSPNGSLAIYWRGRMAQSGAEWLFAEGAAPYLAEHDSSGETFTFTSERALFSDVTIGRDAFTAAAISWGADSDAYAVWSAEWTGLPQGAGGEYPNINRVYFSHATDPRGLTETHAIDEADIPEGSRAVDVKVSPTGQHLVITAAQPRGGVLEEAAADLLLIKRNTGVVADEVFRFNTTDGWFGPAAFEP